MISSRGDHDVLREPAVEPVAAAGGAGRAVVVVAAHAEVAAAAGVDARPRRPDRRARTHVVPGAQLLDPAAGLVPEGERRGVAEVRLGREEVDVGVAQADARHLDQHLARTGPWHLDLTELRGLPPLDELERGHRRHRAHSRASARPAAQARARTAGASFHRAHYDRAAAWGTRRRTSARARKENVMAGVLEGVEVLDLSWGIPGPVTGMLLADHGARVTKIEPPGGDPTRSFSGSRVWHRGKRSAFLDLEERRRPRPPARAARAGRHHPRELLARRHRRASASTTTRSTRSTPASSTRSITAYGLDNKHSDRPGYEALVAARTGQQWESRGVEGGTIARLSGFEGALPGLPVPDDCWTAAKRPGPLFAGTPWASMATAYLATLGDERRAARARADRPGPARRDVTAPGRARDDRRRLAEGRARRRAELPELGDRPRAPKGVFKCKDGRWIHHWTPLPAFVIGVSEGDTLEITDEVTSPRDAPMRIGLAPEEMVLLHHYNPIMAERFAKFPSDEWIAIAAEGRHAGPAHPLTRRGAARRAARADGCVVEVDDPELGPVRQVGRVFQFARRARRHAARPPSRPARTPTR